MLHIVPKWHVTLTLPDRPVLEFEMHNDHWQNVLNDVAKIGFGLTQPIDVRIASAEPAVSSAVLTHSYPKDF